MHFSTFRCQEPVLPVRAIHLDLKGLPPTFARLMELLDVFAAARYNALLVEWEDMFPWTADERFRCFTAYEPQQVRLLAKEAASRGLEIIPLVQCLGHMQTFLRHEAYRDLREVPYRHDCINPLAKGSRQLIERLIDDVLALLPDVRRFHLGGDEAWTLGRHPDTAAFIQAHGPGKLYLHHVTPLLDRLLDQNIRPLLWHDMMRHWDDASLRNLAPRADLVVWGYDGHPDLTTRHYAIDGIRRFKRAGLTLWGASAFKGADGMCSDLPVIATRQANTQAWTDVARREGMAGVIATGWNRYGTQTIQCEPIDACLDCALLCGVILHDGQAPEGGIDACRAALSGEPRFTRCREALAEFATALNGFWAQTRVLRNQLVMQKLCPRTSPGEAVSLFKHVLSLCEQIKSADETVRQAFAGATDDMWMNEYLAPRLTAVLQETSALQSETQQADPTGYREEVKVSR